MFHQNFVKHYRDFHTCTPIWMVYDGKKQLKWMAPGNRGTTCGWLRNPAPPCMVETPLNNGINHVSTGAGFLPSIISPNLPELINKCSFDQECPGNYTGKRTCAMCSYENGDRTPGNRYHIWSAAISPSQMELGFNIAMRSKKMI